LSYVKTIEKIARGRESNRWIRSTRRPAAARLE